MIGIKLVGSRKEDFLQTVDLLHPIVRDRLRFVSIDIEHREVILMYDQEVDNHAYIRNPETGREVQNHD